MEMYMDPRGLGEPITVDSPTDQVIAWTLQRFSSQRMIITTSFGMEGCALIDMYASHHVPLTVVYLDTGFFFPESYELRDRMVERYPHIDFIDRGTRLTADEQKEMHGDELWKCNPDLCCKLRKVEPMYEVMADVDVWITGLRRGQSVNRANLQLVEWDWRYQALKVSPLCQWDRAKIWEHVQKHEVPYNSLHEQGYPSVGCTHCTVPVPGAKLGEYSRAGRWASSEKTECGLHGGAGI
jgi:phosphoadenosine phosphosulfate reductase